MLSGGLSMLLFRIVRAIPLLGVATLFVVTIIAIVIRFLIAELAPTETHTDAVELGRTIYLPSEWAETWRVCGSIGILAMCMMLVAPLLRFLPDDRAA